jgi:hypothetical protein
MPDAVQRCYRGGAEVQVQEWSRGRERWEVDKRWSRADAAVQRCRGAEVQRCRGAEVQRSRGPEVQRSRGSEVQRQR